MISVEAFYDTLIQNELDFFVGVPDSLLKSFCAYIKENVDFKRNIIAANEGSAVGIASGYYLSTHKPAVVYMQNSGIGNAINPLVSLADEEVYRIPMLLIVGWRGEPNVHDEPQHKKQGKITLKLLETIGIKTLIIDPLHFKEQIKYCANYMKREKKSIAIMIRKQTFSNYKIEQEASQYMLTRERALEIIATNLEKEDMIITSTGKLSRELFELREKMGGYHDHDFLTIGSMGHTSSIALGVSLFTDKRVYCIDGDGSFIMHMGALAATTESIGDNYKYIIINNGAHESVGGQPTAGYKIDMLQILKGIGIKQVCQAVNEEEVKKGMDFLKAQKAAMVVYVRQGSRENLGRPTITPIQNKEIFMKSLNKNY